MTDDTEPSFQEKLEQLQRDAKDRHEERKATGRRRSLKDYGAGLLALTALLVVVALVLGVVALIAWFIFESAALILTFLGSVLVIVIASAAWHEMRGKD